MQIMRLNGLAMLILLVSVAVDSIAIETNPFSSLTKVQEESIGLVYSVMDGHKYQWIASENGLYGIQGDIAFKLTSDQLPTTAPISFVFEDTLRQLWVATHGDGIFLLDADLRLIKKLSMIQGLASNFITEITHLNSETVVTASFTGINTIDIVTQEVNNLQVGQKKNIYAILVRGTKLFFGHTNGISSYSLAEKHIQEYPLFESLSPTYVYSIVSDNEKHIYVGTTNGLVVYNVGNLKLETVSQITTKEPVSTIFVD